MTSAIKRLEPRFVEFIPKELESGVIYISIEYTTSAHQCACGCGSKVVLPLHPTEWNVLFDGKTVTLRPSVGNWGFECRSHYLITRNAIQWAGDWSEEQIEAGRKRDQERRAIGRETVKSETSIVEQADQSKVFSTSWLGRLLRLFRRFR